MKNIKLIILQIVFMCGTMLALVCSVFAWFSSNLNSSVNITSIKAASGLNATLKAYKVSADNKAYIYNYVDRKTKESTASYADFTNVDSIEVEDMVPNAMYVLAIEVTGADAGGLDIALSSYSFDNLDTIEAFDKDGNAINNFNAGYAYDLSICSYPDIMSSADSYTDEFNQVVTNAVTGEYEDVFTTEFFNSYDKSTVLHSGYTEMTQTTASNLNATKIPVSANGNATIFITVIFSNDESTFFKMDNDGKYKQDITGNSNIYKNLKFCFDMFLIS